MISDFKIEDYVRLIYDEHPQTAEFLDNSTFDDFVKGTGPFTVTAATTGLYSFCCCLFCVVVILPFDESN